MIYDFTYCNPTKIHFGKTALTRLPSELEQYGKNILLIYVSDTMMMQGKRNLADTSPQNQSYRNIYPLK